MTEPTPTARSGSLRVRSPRGVTRGVTIVVTAWVMLLMGTAGMGFGIGAGSARRYVLDVLLFAGAILTFVGVLAARRSQRELRERARRNGTLLCPECHYELSGVLGNDDRVWTCPECGTRVSRAEIVRAWSRY
jgi:uncharacterized protein YlaI